MNAEQIKEVVIRTAAAHANISPDQALQTVKSVFHQLQQLTQLYGNLDLCEFGIYGARTEGYADNLNSQVIQ